MNITLAQLEILLPLACKWAAEQEAVIVLTGLRLSDAQIVDARKIGVAFPERVRLLRVEKIPAPAQSVLAVAAQLINLISPHTAGLTLRYGIFIRADYWGDRRLVAHELFHTAQYERLGGIENFLRAYLTECILPPGYPNGPLEQEAKRGETAFA